MSEDSFHLLQGTISWATLNNEIQSNNLAWSRFSWHHLENVKVREVHQRHTDRMQWKCDTMKYILMQVVKMKTITWAISICEENWMSEISTWLTYLNELGPNSYLWLSIVELDFCS
jgi:hypothetical protein